jgi:hypothetical protein
MALGGHAILDIDMDKVMNSLFMLIDHVDRGTKKATLAAVKDIYNRSQQLVPRDTNTLANSGYYQVNGNYRVGFTGEVGYGGNGDPVNPKSGQKASEYMIQVHEDLSAHHNTGQAKFLEDAIKEYQASTLGKYYTFLKQETGI